MSLGGVVSAASRFPRIVFRRVPCFRGCCRRRHRQLVSRRPLRGVENRLLRVCAIDSRRRLAYFGRRTKSFGRTGLSGRWWRISAAAARTLRSRFTCSDHAAQRSSRSESPVPAPRSAHPSVSRMRFATTARTTRSPNRLFTGVRAARSAGRDRQDDRGEAVFHGAKRAGQAEWAAAAILPPRKVEEAEIFSPRVGDLASCLCALRGVVLPSFRVSCSALKAAESLAHHRCEPPCQWHTARRREAGRRPQSPRLRACPNGHSGPVRRRYAGRSDL